MGVKLMAISSIGAGIIIPITVVRTGDKAAIAKLSLELKTLQLVTRQATQSSIANASATSRAGVVTGTYTNLLKKQTVTTHLLTVAEAKQLAIIQTKLLINKQRIASQMKVIAAETALGQKLAIATVAHRGFLASFTQVRWAIGSIAKCFLISCVQKNVFSRSVPMAP